MLTIMSKDEVRRAHGELNAWFAKLPLGVKSSLQTLLQQYDLSLTELYKQSVADEEVEAIGDVGELAD